MKRSDWGQERKNHGSDNNRPYNKRPEAVRATALCLAVATLCLWTEKNNARALFFFAKQCSNVE
jgi:hypothetical protein